MEDITPKEPAQLARGREPSAPEPDPVRALGLMLAKRLGIKPLKPGQRRGDGFYTVNHFTGTRKRGSEIPRPMEDP